MVVIVAGIVLWLDSVCLSVSWDNVIFVIVVVVVVVVAVVCYALMSWSVWLDNAAVVWDVWKYGVDAEFRSFTSKCHCMAQWTLLFALAQTRSQFFCSRSIVVIVIAICVVVVVIFVIVDVTIEAYSVMWQHGFMNIHADQFSVLVTVISSSICCCGTVVVGNSFLDSFLHSWEFGNGHVRSRDSWVSGNDVYCSTTHAIKVKVKSAMSQLGRRWGAHLPLVAIEPVGG